MSTSQQHDSEESQTCNVKTDGKYKKFLSSFFPLKHQKQRQQVTARLVLCSSWKALRSEILMCWEKWKKRSFWNLDCFLISEIWMIPSCILLLNDVECLRVCVAGVCAVCKYSWLQQGLTRLSLLQTSQLWLPKLVLHARYHLSSLSLCGPVFFFLTFSSFLLQIGC